MPSRAVPTATAVPATAVGRTWGPVVHDVEPQWTTAHAAAAGGRGGPCFDTTGDDALLAHPLFTVCLEWPLLDGGVPGLGLSWDEGTRAALHATHDVVLHRPIRAGDRLTTTATVEAVEARRPGAYVVARLDTVDAAGGPVATTRHGTLYRDIEVAGTPTPTPVPPVDRAEPDQVESDQVEAVGAGWSVDEGDPYMYSACARIWNPVHTDPGYAARTGFGRPVLHGSATLARAVTLLVDEVGADLGDVRRVSARFGAPVHPPAYLRVRLLGRSEDGSHLRFEVRTADGAPAVRDGVLVLGGEASP